MIAAPEPTYLGEGARLAIPGVGELVLVDDGQLRWQAPEGSVATLDFRDGGRYIHQAADPSRRLAIIVSERSEEVYVLEAARESRARLEQRLHRVEDEVGGLRYVRLLGLEDGILLLYEQGISSFSGEGWLRWRVEHYRIDLMFDHLDGEAVWLHDQERQLDDPERNLIGYRLADGKLVRSEK